MFGLQIPHGLVDKAAYSIYLQNLDGTPALTVGGYDAAKVDGDITWTSIRNANVQAHLGHIEINGEIIDVNKTTPSIPVVGTVSYRKQHISYC